MAWKKGESGNPKGRAVEKSFADALRMEIKNAGDNHQKLREIARKLLDRAAIPRSWSNSSGPSERG
jgi:hypothetical protein